MFNFLIGRATKINRREDVKSRTSRIIQTDRNILNKRTRLGIKELDEIYNLDEDFLTLLGEGILLNTNEIDESAVGAVFTNNTLDEKIMSKLFASRDKEIENLTLKMFQL